MGFRQMNRFGAPEPEVRETDYGATYVKAATETPAEKVEVLDNDEAEAPVVESQAVVTEEKPVVAEECELGTEKAPRKGDAKKKAGRPKKEKK